MEILSALLITSTIATTIAVVCKKITLKKNSTKHKKIRNIFSSFLLFLSIICISFLLFLSAFEETRNLLLLSPLFIGISTIIITILSVIILIKITNFLYCYKNKKEEEIDTNKAINYLIIIIIITIIILIKFFLR